MIKPKLKEIVIHSLQSVQDEVESRKNSFEVFGYDFMLDAEANPWLIEVNSSPSMDYSTVYIYIYIYICYIACNRKTSKIST